MKITVSLYNSTCEMTQQYTFEEMKYANTIYQVISRCFASASVTFERCVNEEKIDQSTEV